MEQKKQTLIFLAILLSVASYVLFLTIDFMTWLAPGDHGRDLYAFERVYQGDLPYKDFWWVYGPAMLYYYGIFYKILGAFIPSIITGQLVLFFLCSVLTYFILSQYMSRLHAFLGSVWMLLHGPQFGFTFNHAGGITFILLNILFLSNYLTTKKIHYLYGCSICVFFLLMIKVNFGLTALFGTLSSVYLFDRIHHIRINPKKLLFFVLTFLVAPLSAFLIYYVLAHDLTPYELRQCFPYLSSDHPHNATPMDALKNFWNLSFNKLSMSKPITYTCLFFVSISLCVLTRKNGIKSLSWRNPSVFFAMILIGFWLINLHEFIVSGVPYRTLWSLPFTILFMSLLLSSSVSKFTKVMRVLCYVIFFILCAHHLYTYQTMIKKAKSPLTYLNIPRGKVHIGNQALNVWTITETTQYLMNNLNEKELFLALPYDPIYYFLTGKKSPTRQLIFFDHINIPEEQEMSIIKELTQNKVNWVVLSSRIRSGETGLGVFGKSYCPKLKSYLDEHFWIEKQIGGWKGHPGWADNHGIAVLKRK